MTNWLLVSSPDNFERSRARGFDVAGMKSRHRRKWERVVPGDRILLYPKRWPAENWTLAFQGNVHELSDADAELLEAAVRAAGPVAVGR